MARRGRTPTLPTSGRGHAWEREAACRTADPEVFFKQHRNSEARAVCEVCPVLAQCRDLIDHIEARTGPVDHFGIWAGETPRERTRRRWKEMHVAG